MLRPFLHARLLLRSWLALVLLASLVVARSSGDLSLAALQCREYLASAFEHCTPLHSPAYNCQICGFGFGCIPTLACPQQRLQNSSDTSLFRLLQSSLPGVQGCIAKRTLSCPVGDQTCFECNLQCQASLVNNGLCAVDAIADTLTTSTTSSARPIATINSSNKDTNSETDNSSFNTNHSTLIITLSIIAACIAIIGIVMCIKLRSRQYKKHRPCGILMACFRCPCCPSSKRKRKNTRTSSRDDYQSNNRSTTMEDEADNVWSRSPDIDFVFAGGRTKRVSSIYQHRLSTSSQTSIEYIGGLRQLPSHHNHKMLPVDAVTYVNDEKYMPSQFNTNTLSRLSEVADENDNGSNISVDLALEQSDDRVRRSYSLSYINDNGQNEEVYTPDTVQPYTIQTLPINLSQTPLSTLSLSSDNLTITRLTADDSFMTKNADNSRPISQLPLILQSDQPISPSMLIYQNRQLHPLIPKQSSAVPPITPIEARMLSNRFHERLTRPASYRLSIASKTSSSHATPLSQPNPQLSATVLNDSTETIKRVRSPILGRLAISGNL